MRNQWRLLLLRSQIGNTRHSSQSLTRFQVHSSPPFSRSFSSFMHSPAPLLHQNPKTPSFRCFSTSELAVDHKESDQIAVISDVFSKPLTSNDAIKLELESNNVVLGHDLVLSVLQNPNTSPDVARKLFSWVSEVESERLSSKSYNFMLGILGANGFVKDFWDLAEIMKKKGYGVAKGTIVRVSRKFESEGLSADLERLNGLYVAGSTDTSVEKVCSRVSKVIRQDVWGYNVEKQLLEMNVVFLSNSIEMVLENLESDPNKALIFFRWVEESGLFKHDERTYNVMARVLGREEYTEKFWRVIDEMRSAGYEMATGTYVKVLNRFIKMRLIKDSVYLYELAMTGANKPSVQDCTFLLRKIVVSKELDMDLFLRVVRVYKESGNVLTNSILDAALKSLISVGRLGECNKILKAMEEGGLLLNGNLQGKIAFHLSSDGKNDEVDEFIDNIEASGNAPDYQTWVSLVEGYYVAGDLDKASDCIQKMIRKVGLSSTGYVFELLVTAYCSKNRTMDAFELLSALVEEKELKPRHTTYKALIGKLLVKGHFKESLHLIGLMKSQGFPPFLDPFIKYISKTGTANDALLLLKSMTVKRFPSTDVFLRVFNAYFKAGRHDEAQNFLSRCPGYIRNHADVLNLFYSEKASDETSRGAAVPS